MLSLNKEGSPLAKIIGGKYNNKVISISEEISEDSFRSLQIANECNFQLLPNPKTERQILYITGPSGSGKSTFVRTYLEQYKKYSQKTLYIYFHLYLMTRV